MLRLMDLEKKAEARARLIEHLFAEVKDARQRIEALEAKLAPPDGITMAGLPPSTINDTMRELAQRKPGRPRKDAH